MTKVSKASKGTRTKEKKAAKPRGLKKKPAATFASLEKDAAASPNRSIDATSMEALERWGTKYGVSPNQLKHAIAKVGGDPGAVQLWLKRKFADNALPPGLRPR